MTSRQRFGAELYCSSRQDNGRPANLAAALKIATSPGPQSELTSSTPLPARFIAIANAFRDVIDKEHGAFQAGITTVDHCVHTSLPCAIAVRANSAQAGNRFSKFNR